MEETRGSEDGGCSARGRDGRIEAVGFEARRVEHRGGSGGWGRLEEARRGLTRLEGGSGIREAEGWGEGWRKAEREKLARG